MALLPRFGRSPPAPFWEQYIDDENTVELIYTDSLPLVISLNGHTLQEYMQETRGYALQPVPSTQASIRGGSEQIELLNIRKETHEEYALSRPRGLREALLIVALLPDVLFLPDYPDVFVPWLAGGASAAGRRSVGAIRAPAKISSLREIHCLRGTPRRWDCLAKTFRNRSTIFHSVLSTWSIPHTGSHTLLRSRSTNQY